MKRYYFFVVVMFSALSVFAETSISRTFLGCTLGKSTSKEVKSTLTSRGFSLDFDTILDARILVYDFKGLSYNHEGAEFHSFSTFCVNDTLLMVYMQDSCRVDSPNFSRVVLRNLNNKYGDFNAVSHTQLFNALVRKIDAEDVSTQSSDALDAWLDDRQRNWIDSAIEMWSRTDGHTMVGTFSSDRSCACWYINCRYVNEDAYRSLLFAEKGTIVGAFDNMPDYAEANKVYGVAGVKFGDDRETVRRAIAQRSDRLLDSDSHSLTFYDVQVGGMNYDFATFYFVRGKGLVSVYLEKPFDVWKKEEAIMMYETIFAQYRRKYSNFKVMLDDMDHKFCVCGAYVDGYRNSPIFISYDKSLSKGGDIKYYVSVSYYGARKSNLYDDEI